MPYLCQILRQLKNYIVINYACAKEADKYFLHNCFDLIWGLRFKTFYGRNCCRIIIS